MSKKYTCPNCEYKSELADSEIKVNNIFTCDGCDSGYIITSTEPFRCELLADDDL